MQAVQEKIYTVEEYFELEKTSEVRHEFVNGTLIEMPGESKKANRIARKIVRILEKVLNEKVFDIFTHDVRVYVTDTHYRYPDVVVSPTVDDADSHAVMLPVLIVEVLSDSTSEIDTFIKTREYCSLPSLQHYLIVSQDETVVQLYSRREKTWEFSFYSTLEESIPLNNLEIALPMNEVFE